MSESRKIAVILVADVVGYSPLVGAGEDRTPSRFRAPPEPLVDSAIVADHGRMIKPPAMGASWSFDSCSTQRAALGFRF
jgi:adenylate cyclase